MGYLSRLARFLTRQRAVPPQRLSGNRVAWFGRSRAGVPVDHDIALTYSTVWDCVRIISETLAAMPWRIHRKTGDGGRELLDNHRVDYLLNHRANSETAAFDFKQTIIAHTLLWGNGYAEIDRSPAGTISNLWQLRPDQVTPGRFADGSLGYEVRPETGGTIALRADQVLHFRGMGFDGIVGYSVVHYAAQSIGLGLATERFGSEFFGHGAHAGGVLQHPGKLSETAQINLKESLNEAIGPGQWRRPLLLEENMTWKNTTVPPDDAQFLETRRFQIAEIARWFRMPLFKLQELGDAAVRANVEHSGIEFVTDTILPWAKRFEGESDIKLLPRQSRQGVFTRINLNSLLRGDLESRYKAYAIGREKGWLTANDVRRLEDMNPISKEDGGDTYMVQVNMQGQGNLLLGPPGPQGKAGSPGESGEDGKAGPQGDPGEPGAAGERGLPGVGGRAGDAGPAGPLGEQGVPGNVGEHGETGPSGTNGAIGSRGEPGRQGATGDPGERGTNGERGDLGERGERGESGGAGDKGDPGARGLQGESGERGGRGKDAQPYGPALQRILMEAITRVCRSEAGTVENARRQHDNDEFDGWCVGFYRSNQGYIREKVFPVVLSLLEMAKGCKASQGEKRTLGAIVDTYAEGRCLQSLDELRGAADMPALLTEWRTSRIKADTTALMARLAMPVLFGVVSDAST